jgi:NADH dehydrogenase FAD-containing subunit
VPPERRLLLVGAGHAHLHLVRQAFRLARVGYRTTLVAPRWFDCSGAASSVAAGDRDPGEGRIDVAALTRHRPLDHRRGLVTDVDPMTRTATLDDGARHEWDLVSLNIGSVVDLTSDGSSPGCAGPDG